MRATRVARPTARKAAWSASRCGAEAMAWYERLEAARRDGAPFDEPPPFLDANGRAP